MSGNVLLTVNAGRCLLPTSRASLEAAADRWGVPLVEWTAPPLPPVADRPHLWRLWMFDGLAADRIFYIDADTVIRSDTPSPFAAFPDPSTTYAVRDMPRCPNLDALREAQARASNHARYHLEQATQQAWPYWLDRYFNSGVLLASRAQWAQGVGVVREQALCNPEPYWQDQSYLNVWLQNAGLTLIDRTWNHLNPPPGPMQSYVYHFAGMSGEKRARRIPWVAWKVPG